MECERERGESKCLWWCWWCWWCVKGRFVVPRWNSNGTRHVQSVYHRIIIYLFMVQHLPAGVATAHPLQFYTIDSLSHSLPLSTHFSHFHRCHYTCKFYPPVDYIRLTPNSCWRRAVTLNRTINQHIMAVQCSSFDSVRFFFQSQPMPLCRIRLIESL